jgi:predicted nucleotide-binding protein/8-oxo-dGTP pyrophosphatase MutT (NUDIX family)
MQGSAVDPITQSGPEKLRRVFVVHGRNERLRKGMFTFLRSIGLEPLEFSEARKHTRNPSPYIGEIVEAAFERAQAIVVLFTPDDEARLRSNLQTTDVPSYERNLIGQPRQNVLFEAGFAIASHPNQTVFVQIGEIRPFSDMSGMHFVHMNNSTQKRQELASRLQDAGCPINLNGIDWHTDGDLAGEPCGPFPGKERNVSQRIAKVLETFADSPAPRQIAEIADQCELTEDLLRGALTVLRPLGLFAEAGGTISWGQEDPEIARLAVRSMSRAIQNDLTLVGDWNAEAAEPRSPDNVLRKGAHFLWLIEQRRYACGDKKPIYREEIARVVIKAQGRDGEDYFLMHFGKNPQRFQLVGGKIEGRETPQEALLREMDEEIPADRLELGKDYKLSEPREIPFFYQSTRTGAFTQYNIFHFLATDMKGPPRLSRNLRWVRLNEIARGRTKDGEGILPPSEHVQPLIELLKDAQLSFIATIDP